jgi:hypothetical protein
MGVIEVVGIFLFWVFLIAFLGTGTVFFMAAYNILNSADNMLRKVGMIAIPMGSSKKPVTGSNSDPV